MHGNQLALLALLVIFVVDALLLLGLITLKAVHRRRVLNHDARRAEYVALLSRHLTIDHHTEPIGLRIAEDPAFLDALIDVRNALSGPEIDTMSAIVDRYRIVDDLSKRLKSRFPLGRRLRAAVALAELGDESSVAVLTEYLDDRIPEVRIQCARGLGRIRWTPAIDAIVERLSFETPWVRSRFADTLIGFGSRATWPLLAYIRVNHRHESAGPAMAIRTLAAIGDTQAGVPLTELLAEATDPEIQLPILEALGSLGGPLAIRPLTRMAKENDWRLRAKAATALGEIGDSASIPILRAGLEDSNWWVRRNSASALARIHGGIDTLYESLESPDRFARDAAAEALVDAGELAAARARMAEGDEEERDHRLISHMTGEVGIPA